MCKHILFNDFNGDNDLQTLYRFVNQTYDKDGYGAIIRDYDNKLYTFKSLDQTEFYLTIGRFIQSVSVKTLVVHHRTSTNGDGLAYAHPFEYQGNYMTHNGVVTVPGVHDTLTTNDTEELLHHLIKTGYDTPTIQGYYSCFILNAIETVVLVDDKAPLYASRDERVYSSHKLGKKWKKLEKQRIHIPLGGAERTTFNIEVCASTYGQDKAHLSLGAPWQDTGWKSSWEDETTGAIKFKEDGEGYDPRYGNDPIGEFLDYIRHDEEEAFAECRSYAALLEAINETGYNLGLRLTARDIEELAGFYLDREDQRA